MALDANEPVIAEDEIIVLDLDENDTPQEAVEMTMDLPELTGDEERKARGDFLEEPDPEPDRESETDPEPGKQKDSGEDLSADGEADPDPDLDKDEEPEPDLDKKEESDPQPEPEPKKSDNDEFVPYGRLAKKHSQLQEAKARIAELEADAAKEGQKPPSDEQPEPSEEKEVFDFDKVNGQWNDAVIEGDTELATSLYKKIHDHQQSVARAAAVDVVRNEQAQSEIKKVADDIYENSDGYFDDPVNINIFNAAREGLMESQGLSYQDAMKAAAKRLFPKISEPEEKDTGSDGPDLREKGLSEQKKKAVQKNAKAARQQPPRTDTGQGLRRERPVKSKDAFSMPDSTYNDMSATEKEKLNGSILDNQ